MRVCSTTRVVKQSGLGGSIRKEGCFINYHTGFKVLCAVFWFLMWGDRSDQVNLHKWNSRTSNRLLTQIFVHLQQDQCPFQEGIPNSRSIFKMGSNECHIQFK